MGGGGVIYLVLVLGMVPLKEGKTGRCHAGPNKWTPDAYQWDTRRHILVSDKSRKVSGTDHVRDGNWGVGLGNGDADYLAIAPELQPSRQGGRSVKGRQTKGRMRWERTFCTLHRIPAGGLGDA